MERWIKTYPKIFSQDECEGLIEYFEEAKALFNNNKKVYVRTREDHDFEVSGLDEKFTGRLNSEKCALYQNQILD